MTLNEHTHNGTYLMRFRLHSDASLEHRGCYNKIYMEILSNDRAMFDKYIYAWMSMLKEKHIGTETDRKYLDRFEGGIGGNSNNTNRQIRLHNDYELLCTWHKYNEITFQAVPSDNGESTWDTNELLEFGNAFKEVLETYMNSRCIDFYIAID